MHACARSVHVREERSVHRLCHDKVSLKTISERVMNYAISHLDRSSLRPLEEGVSELVSVTYSTTSEEHV